MAGCLLGRRWVAWPVWGLGVVALVSGSGGAGVVLAEGAGAGGVYLFVVGDEGFHVGATWRRYFVGSWAHARILCARGCECDPLIQVKFADHGGAWCVLRAAGVPGVTVWRHGVTLDRHDEAPQALCRAGSKPGVRARRARIWVGG